MSEITYAAINKLMSNVFCFLFYKGESIAMMQTPTTDGLAFGYKKIRLNTKKKYGLFHVNLTKIDYSVNQNLENVLRIKQ